MSPLAQVPHLQPYPAPLSVVVMDNFVTHHNEDVFEAIEATGAVVHHTPAYSPDMTPIELPFAKIKAHLRGPHKARLEQVRKPGCMVLFASCADARWTQMDPVLAIDDACRTVSVEDCRGYIAHACSMYNDFYLQS